MDPRETVNVAKANPKVVEAKAATLRAQLK